MTDATGDFLDRLSKRGYEPALAKATGNIKIELADNGAIARWFVAIDKGHVKVSRRNGSPDCALRSDKKTFDGIVAGKTNAMAATLRGALQFDGDPKLLVLFQRLFPALGRHPKVTTASGAKR